MLTLLIVLGVVGGVAAGCHYGLEWTGTWSIVAAFVVGFILQLAMGLFFRKKIMGIMSEMQLNLSSAAEGLRRKYEALANRGGNVKQLMSQAEREQATLLLDAVEYTKLLDPYRKWSMFLGRQIAAIRMQFYFQMKDYANVDALLPKVMVVEPSTATMKMARQYMNGDLAGLDKTYKKYAKKFKANSVLIYALMSWIRVKQDRIDDAIQVLLQGQKQTANETLAKNLDLLRNGKVKQFSNAEFGEPWYVLQLEEMKQPKGAASHAPAIHPGQRQMMMNGGRGMRRR